jgi:hypothetical protein
MFRMNHISIVLLSLLLFRVLITGAQIGEAIGLLSLAGLSALQLYIEFKREPEVNKELKTRLVTLEDKVSKQDGKISAITLNSQLRR